MIPVLNRNFKFSNGKLILDNSIVYPLLEGSDDRLLNTSSYKQLTDSMGFNADKIQYPGLGVYNIDSNFNIKKGDKSLSFTSPSSNTPDISSLTTSDSNISTANQELYKNIIRSKGLKCWMDSRNARHWFRSKVSGDRSEIFIPKGDQGTEYVPCYLHYDIPLTRLDLTGAYFYKPESSEFKYAITKEALVELIFEDKEIGYITLANGMNYELGVRVKDFVLRSQRVINEINIYYEVDKSLYI